MPEDDIRRETLRAGTPLTVGAVALLPIERVVLHALRIHRASYCAARKEPYALIVRDAEGVRVIGVGAAAPTLEALRSQVPDFDSVLAAV